MSKVLSTRIDDETSKRIERASKTARLDKTALIKIVLLKGLDQIEEDEALNAYAEGEISLGKLADLLDINKWDALDLLTRKKIPVNYSKEDFQEDLSAL